MICPCDECLISTMCSEECLDLYRFINKAANGLMCLKQREYIETLPNKLRQRIADFSFLDFHYMIRKYSDCTEVSIERKNKERII